MAIIPPVSIGLPVFNGERYLSQAIESILVQEFGDFHFIISDNSSTDSTWDICRSYVSLDSRIKLYRNGSNLGAIENFNKVFRLCSSPYFMWTSHDDLLAPSYVKRCLNFLEENPDYVLCCSLNTVIDQNGDERHTPMLDPSSNSNDVIERYRKWLKNEGVPTAIYGLFRTAATKDLRLPGTYGPDHIYMLQMIIAGKIHQINEPLRFYRRHRQYLSIEEGFEFESRQLHGEGAAVERLPWLNYWRARVSTLRAAPLKKSTKVRLACLSIFRRETLSEAYVSLIHIIKYATYKYPLIYSILRTIKQWSRGHLLH